MTRKPAVIFDIDGTLADMTSLRDYVEGRDTDYDAFHVKSLEVPPIQWVVDRTWYYQEIGYHVIAVTARQDRYRSVTEQWMRKNAVYWDTMLMRPTEDWREDYLVKKEILGQILDQGFAVVHAYDDNPDTYMLWLQHNIPTTVVPGWPLMATQNGR